MGAYEMYDDDEEEDDVVPTETADDVLVDNEPIGPEPTEFRPVLTFAVILIALVLCWYLLGEPTPVGLGLP
jgi:hypothetical protein